MGKIKVFAKSSDLNYPDIKPTLNLNFAASKSLDSRITYSRNSIGTYVGADGYIKTAVANEPRFDYDPTTGKCLGLLVEPSRTNLALWSENLSQSSWYASTRIANQGVSPDGLSNAWRVTYSGYGGLNQAVSITSGVTYTVSVWLKAVPGMTYPAGTVMVGANVFPAQDFSSIIRTDVWTRCSGTFTSTTTSNWEIFFGRNQTGNGTYSVYAWGAQMEVGDYASSYIPTSGSTVTRQADVVEMTGTNFSNWYNSTEGTLLSIGEENSHKISSNTLTISSNSSSKDVVPNILYYPKTIQYPTLRTMNAYPSQVTDGLVLQLDAGLKKSYVGVGTFWNDLSGNGNTGTLINGPTYSSSNGGSIVFDGVNDYVSGSIPTLSDWSICLWYLSTDITSNPVFYPFSGTTTSNGLGFGGSFDATTINRWYFFDGTNSMSVSNQLVSTNIWYNLVVTKSSITYNLYTNGSLSLKTFGVDLYLTQYNLGRRGSSGGEWYAKGNIAQVSIYNRALSAAEVQQNFNALRGRFGL